MMDNVPCVIKFSQYKGWKDSSFSGQFFSFQCNSFSRRSCLLIVVLKIELL